MGWRIPVIGILVMPFALSRRVLMPFGLEALPLWIMGEGLKLVIVISDWVAGFPAPTWSLPQPSALSVMLVASGTVLICLLAGPLRLAGLRGHWHRRCTDAVARQQRPDILIERTGQNVAIRDAEGLLVPAYATQRARFTVEKWLQVNGEEATPADAAKRPGWTCTETRCDADGEGQAHRLCQQGRRPAPLDCGGIDILIADFPLRGACRGRAAPHRPFRPVAQGRPCRRALRRSRHRHRNGSRSAGQPALGGGAPSARTTTLPPSGDRA